MKNLNTIIPKSIVNVIYYKKAFLHYMRACPVYSRIKEEHISLFRICEKLFGRERIAERIKDYVRNFESRHIWNCRGNYRMVAD